MNSARNRVMASGLVLVLLAEVIALIIARRAALPIAGLAVAVMAYELRSHLAGARPDPPETPPGNGALE